MQYSLCDPVSGLNNDINARAKVEADLSINVKRYSYVDRVGRWG